MKIVKVKIRKKLTVGASGILCENFYPQGYRAKQPYSSGGVDVVAYDKAPLLDGDNEGYCIGIVSDTFVFTADMVEITKIEAESFIDARANIEPTQEFQNKYKQRRAQLV